MKNVWLIIGVVVAILVFLALGFAGGGMMGDGFGRGMMGRFGTPGFGLMFPFLCVAGPIFWVLLIAGVIWLIATQLQKNAGWSGTAAYESALDILKARYARGEITKEQFEEMKKTIE